MTTKKQLNNKIDLINETKVIEILTTWPNISNVEKASFSEDINNKIDVKYDYNGNQTYAQLKPFSWNKTTKANKLSYLQKITKFIDNTKNLTENDPNYLNNITNFYFIFWQKNKKKANSKETISITKIITINNLINDINSSQTVDFYKAKINWPNSDVDSIKLLLAESIINVSKHNWVDYIPASFVAQTGLSSDDLRSIVAKDEELKHFWSLLDKKITYYKAREVLVDHYAKVGYTNDDQTEFNLSNSFKDNKDVVNAMGNYDFSTAIVEPIDNKKDYSNFEADENE